MIRLSVVGENGKKNIIAEEGKTVAEAFVEAGVSTARGTVQLNGRVISGEELDMPIGAFLRAGAETASLYCTLQKDNA